MTHESVEHLVQMANDIGNFFRAEPKREEAIAGIAGHINRYWTPRMRQKILDAVAHGEQGLDDLPRAAMAKVIVTPAQSRSAPPQGVASGGVASGGAASGGAATAAGSAPTVQPE